MKQKTATKKNRKSSNVQKEEEEKDSPKERDS